MSHLSRETTSNQKDVIDAPLELTHNPTPYFLETPNERDRRIRNLFESLDRNGTGYLDSDCILKGFQQMTHLPARTKYARDLLEKCDTSQDGVIDYDEFKIYVEEREKELWAMFEEIDRSGDGRLQPEELEHALQRAGIRVTKDDFWQFMEAMDSDGNGVIDFQEWRDFLLVRYVHWLRKKKTYIIVDLALTTFM
jgi:solute carrier family 25 phosphate transporter 23/24/25/41